MEGHVLLLTGPPGSGKSTIARLVCQEFERSVHLESDVFFRFIQGGYIEPWRSESHEQNDVVMRLVGDVAAAYATAGYVTIVDGILLPDWYLMPVMDRLHEDGHDVAVAVLRPPLATCVERTAARGHGSVDTAAIERIWNGFADMGAFEARVIDNVAEPPTETAGRVLELLPNAGRRA